MTMADLSQLQVTADVSESDVASVKNGQSATINLNAAPGADYGATVSFISPTSTTVSNVVEYAVTLSLTAAVPPSVRPGQSASITIVTGEASDAVYVPSAAVTTTGTRSVVTVVGANGQDTVTPVTVGLVGNTDTQVTSGLTVGQNVVLSLTTTSGTGTTGRGFGGLTGTGGGGGFGGGTGVGGGAGGLG
jgi:multidrug efflux pump subunit AcrA (membrane-fusion protein)